MILQLVALRCYWIPNKSLTGSWLNFFISRAKKTYHGRNKLSRGESVKISRLFVVSTGSVLMSKYRTNWLAFQYDRIWACHGVVSFLALDHHPSFATQNPLVFHCGLIMHFIHRPSDTSDFPWALVKRPFRTLWITAAGQPESNFRCVNGYLPISWVPNMLLVCSCILLTNRSVETRAVYSRYNSARCPFEIRSLSWALPPGASNLFHFYAHFLSHLCNL